MAENGPWGSGALLALAALWSCLSGPNSSALLRLPRGAGGLLPVVQRVQWRGLNLDLCTSGWLQSW